MWRSFFFALGIMLLIIGVECLLIDSATLGGERTETVQVANNWLQGPQSVEVSKGGKQVSPPDWVPWSFIFSGAVVVLYSMSLPNRWGNSG
ncbi:MAG: hypothetical protein ACE361_23140 [Aureliella sp.]